MKILRKNLIGVFALGIFLLNACSSVDVANRNTDAANQTANKTDAQMVRDDAEELGKIINLPFAPEEATWREDSAPNGKRLTAVMKFSAEDAANIVRQAESVKPPVNSAIDAETWFPAELVAQSQLSGDESLKGITFAADNFFKPPYDQGKITRVSDTNFFVLELTAP